MVGERSAVALVAHADDETLGCGGTLAHLATSGWDVRVVVLTNGIVTARGPDLQDNREDCARACATLGLAPPTWVGFPDQELDRHSITELSTAVNDLGLDPHLIISHSPLDLNVDHRITAEVARVVGRPRHHPISIVACEIPANAPWNGHAFPVNHYVDVSRTIDAKVEAFGCYRNERRDATDPTSPDGLRLLAAYHGMHAGMVAAEAFTVLRGASGQLP